MIRKFTFAIVGLTLLAAPFVVSAQTLTIPQLPPNPTIQDLQTEIQQLTQIVIQLIAERTSIGGSTTSGTASVPVASNSGTPPTLPPTNSVVPIGGIASAATPPAAPNPTPVATFTASPTSGAAPLTVTFSSSQGGTINFGDGQTGTIPPAQCAQTATIGSTPICDQGTVTHVYTSAGTYTATLGINAGYTCPVVDIGSLASVMSNWSCAWQSGQTFGSQTITVTGSATSTPTICPVYTFPLCPTGQHNVITHSTGSNGCDVETNACAANTTTPPVACPVYLFPLCPPGQQNEPGPVTTDANGCQVPHNTCVPATTTPTCTYGGVTTPIQGGSSACSSWCLSQQTGVGSGYGAIGGAPNPAPPSLLGSYSCVYMDSTGVSQTIASAPAPSANVANALTGLESVLQSFLAGIGK
jgi:hypothetical protein